MRISFPAEYFDGQSARSRNVVVDVEEGMVCLQGDGSPSWPVDAVELAPRVGHAPCRINLPGGGLLVSGEHALISQAFPAYASRTLAHRLEAHLGLVMASLVGVIIAVWLGYQYGVPRLADAIARSLPPTLENDLGVEALKAMDRIVFKPSTLPEARRAELARLFDNARALALPDARVAFHVRDGGWLGPNALALPGGIVVLTDQLVAAMTSDDQIFAVMAHELGHLSHRHSLRHVLHDSVTGLFAMTVFGDASAVAGIAATLPTTLAHAGYSRDFEREADAFATDVLRRAGLSPAALAEALEALEAAVRKDEDGRGGKGNGREWAYLSTHPSTAERARAAREAAR